MNKNVLTFIGILVLALICMVISLVSALVFWFIAVALVWALSSSGGLAAYLITSFTILYIATIIKVANRIEDNK